MTLKSPPETKPKKNHKQTINYKCTHIMRPLCFLLRLRVSRYVWLHATASRSGNVGK